MALKLLTLIIFTIVGCSIGSQGVYYKEMEVKPTIIISGDTLKVKVSQPHENSALVLYRIDLSVDHNKKEVFISAEEGIGREFQDSLTVNLKDYKIDVASTYSFYWIDPPIKKTIKLEVLKVAN